MIPRRLLHALLLTASACATPYPPQIPLFNDPSSSPNGDRDSTSSGTNSSRALTGRFLHITDFHPDSHYKSGTDIDDSACHRGHGSAGYFGAEGSDCDTPFTLVNETFRWIENNLKDKVDFVVWTGDSARHDSDEKFPRTEEEVVRLNQYLTDKFVDTFRSEESPRGLSIPVVPTIGNNDILPHNIFKDGPNRWTKKFLDIWKKFIPEYQRHSFVEGGWYAVEVIPNKLAVMSLNTMYFFESNSAVDGCADKSEPGYEHMEWLRVQLELLRSRHMKAILIGHVPPARSSAKRNWDETCWQKYALWVNRYRDVIVGSLYGHMNIDHFMLQDSHQVDIVDSQSSADADSSDEISIQSRSEYLSSLRKDWGKMPTPPDDMSDVVGWMDAWLEEDFVTGAGGDIDPQGRKKRRRFLEKIGGPWAERYSVSLVSPSVVPNYFPTLRVVEYNITGLEDAAIWAESSSADETPVDDSDSDLSDEPSIDLKKGGKKKKKKPDFKAPKPPSSSTPPGPAYSNQPLTWLSYTQYYANLTKINHEVSKKQESSRAESSGVDVPVIFEVEYDTKEDDIYKMKDLTVKSYFQLAVRIADKNPPKDDTLVSVDSSLDDGLLEPEQKKKHKNRVWRSFFKRAFVGLVDDDDLDDAV
ncbi:Endopolyphosphatase [Aspergillus nanangensis]|uniref:Endopolyphosphatase n=1 Tax=Aspergillus nanangensis TaxID=2582783 RepID=A0AAD4GTN7_ASPNN|nr:Endopolyphosphatase [Aspergillus nanangensis]